MKQKIISILCVIALFIQVVPVFLALDVRGGDARISNAMQAPEGEAPPREAPSLQGALPDEEAALEPLAPPDPDEAQADSKQDDPLPDSAGELEITILPEEGQPLDDEQPMAFTTMAASTNSIDLSLNANKPRYLVQVSALNFTEGFEFTLTYDPAALELLDACALTPGAVLSTGLIPETGITIESVDPANGEIEFSLDKTIPAGYTWSGVLNVFSFAPKTSGSTTLSCTGSNQGTTPPSNGPYTLTGGRYEVDAYFDEGITIEAYPRNVRGELVTAPELVSLIYIAESGAISTTGYIIYEEFDIYPGSITTITARAEFIDGSIVEATIVIEAPFISVR